MGPQDILRLSLSHW